jgi:hypothetical protein
MRQRMAPPEIVNRLFATRSGETCSAASTAPHAFPTTSNA